MISHLDDLVDTPEAVPEVQAFALALAVRGLLVKPEPTDGTSADLVSRLRAQTRRRTQAGDFKEPRNAIEIPQHSLPFVAPERWQWIRLIEVADVAYGYAFPSAGFNSNGRGMPLIRIRDISRTDTEAYFEGEFNAAYVVKPGDYVVGMDGDFNIRRWNGPDGLLNQRVMRITNWRGGVAPEFLAIPLQMILDHLHAGTSQTTVKHLSAKQVNGIWVPVPPSAEQRRIVGRLGMIESILDRLEAQLALLRSQREALRVAIFHEALAAPSR